MGNGCLMGIISLLKDDKKFWDWLHNNVNVHWTTIAKNDQDNKFHVYFNKIKKRETK